MRRETRRELQWGKGTTMTDRTNGNGDEQTTNGNHANSEERDCDDAARENEVLGASGHGARIAACGHARQARSTRNGRVGRCNTG